VFESAAVFITVLQKYDYSHVRNEANAQKGKTAFPGYMTK
jgi:hypothetical protein